jgi:hypothetical protein
VNAVNIVRTGQKNGWTPQEDFELDRVGNPPGFSFDADASVAAHLMVFDSSTADVCYGNAGQWAESSLFETKQSDGYRLFENCVGEPNED